MPVISRLESSSFPPLDKPIETKDNDFQVQNLSWGPPIVWFPGAPSFPGEFFSGGPRSFAAKNISVSPISWIV